MSEITERPALVNTRAAITYLGGSPSLLRRLRQSRWVAPVAGATKGGSCLYITAELAEAVTRLREGDLLPPLSPGGDQ